MAHAKGTSSPSDNRRAREIERTRQDILEAAAREFARSGFHAATMQAIARAAGFTAASLYTYFESKDAIYRALVEDLRARLLAIFELPEPAGLSLAQRLELLLQRQLGLVVERMDALRALTEAAPPRREDVTIFVEYVDRLARFLAEAGRRELRVPPRVAAQFLCSMLQTPTFLSILGGEELDPPQLARQVVDLFLRGAARPERA